MRAKEFAAEMRCSVIGRIESLEVRGTMDGRSSLGALLAVEGGGFLRLTWFNQPYRQQQLSRGLRLVANGTLKSTGYSWQMIHPEIAILADDEAPPAGKPQPIYPLTEGLQQRQVREMISTALEACGPLVLESMPDDFRRLHGLAAISDALLNVHQPKSMEAVQRGRYRFIFQELLTYQLAIAWRRQQLRNQGQAVSMPPTGAIHARILQRLGLTLTDDQNRVIREMGVDMSQTVPMNRLIQGDVGSGKTLVAQYAMLLAAAYRYQAAFMAPTEVLANQHANRLAKSLADSQCHVELLTAAIQGRERRELLERIALGTVDIVVGTHALLSEKVMFAKLGLVVIDEQHKFGVAQRAALRTGQQQPHYLLLSATPIPRTLTMTSMGEMDVSILREKPPGRAPVHTYLGKANQKESWWNFVAKHLREGRQAYVVVPRLIGDLDEDIHGVEEVYQQLSQGPLQGLSIDLLHGRLESDEKNRILQAFDRGAIQVLIATTVIEVGIDVPNATLMTILDADRFGLAQLHQLRGRVARGTNPGYVCLFPSVGVSPDENERLSAMLETDDGFRLAEIDWKMRGPGNLLGTKQSGLPPFKMADLVRDAEIAEKTHQIARELIHADPEFSAEPWRRLRQQVVGKHGSMLEFGTVG
jgi:ATP-dependent DNA helicase RecG